MLQPKKTKFRRQQKGRMKGNAQRGNQLAFGSFGIKTLESKWITGRQIEAARIAVTRYMQRQGQIWIRIFPDKPITKKPAEVRMGKGKGSPEGFVAPVTPGRIIIEVEGVSYDIAKEALRLAAQKLPRDHQIRRPPRLRPHPKRVTSHEERRNQRNRRQPTSASVSSRWRKNICSCASTMQ